MRDLGLVLLGAGATCLGMAVALAGMQYASLYAVAKLANQFFGG